MTNAHRVMMPYAEMALGYLRGAPSGSLPSDCMRTCIANAMHHWPALVSVCMSHACTDCLSSPAVRSACADALAGCHP